MTTFEVRSQYAVIVAGLWVLIWTAVGCSVDLPVGNVNNSNNLNNSNVTPPECGDGIAEGGEGCDDGAANSDTAPDACRTNCVLAHCGDGVFDAGEECDFADANSDDQANACRTSCMLPRCGDGVTDHNEECDDAAGNSDTTPNACRVDCIRPSCGDGIVDSGEECDDATANSNTASDACRLQCLNPHCGDGVVDIGEPCDDGNLHNWDACDTACTALPFIQATLVWEVGSQGSADGQFDLAGDIAVDSVGNIYVCDFFNNRVQKLGPDGTYLLQWPHAGAHDIEVDEFDQVYVWGDGVMSKYDGSGIELVDFKGLSFVLARNYSNNFAVSMVSDELAILNISNDVFNTSPAGIITTAGDRKVVRTTKSTADYIGQFGDPGWGVGQFVRPHAVQYDSAGHLHVFDTETDRVESFDAGVHIGTVSVNLNAYEWTSFVIDHADRMYFRTGGTYIDVFSLDGLKSCELSVAYGFPSTVGTLCMEIWYDAASSSTYLFTNHSHTVHKYLLEFTHW